tara:strand:+ start:235 stop:399 length:165 start_codon:yes stop_codon:yes gene_type:complete
MTNLGLELLILTVLLIYFGVFMKQSFYKQGIRAHLCKKNFCVKSQSDPYCTNEQ